jgi:tetratricopeptide (TPR) repeat protein
LLALTYALKEYDHWMHDNECHEKVGEMEKAIKCLEKAWKTTLACTDDELGIDGEYSRPGIEALLGQFEEAVGELDSGDYPFEWQ